LLVELQGIVFIGHLGIATRLNHVIETILASKILATLRKKIGTYACPHLMDLPINWVN
jgi:hypothetical protein